MEVRMKWLTLLMSESPSPLSFSECSGLCLLPFVCFLTSFCERNCELLLSVKLKQFCFAFISHETVVIKLHGAHNVNFVDVHI